MLLLRRPLPSARITLFFVTVGMIRKKDAGGSCAQIKHDLLIREVRPINELDRLGLIAFDQGPKGGVGQALGVSLPGSLPATPRGLRCTRLGCKRWPLSSTQNHTTTVRLTPGPVTRKCQRIYGRWPQDQKEPMHAAVNLVWKAQRPRAEWSACR